MAINQEEVQQRIKIAENEAALAALRVELLGRKGALTNELKQIGNLPVGERAGEGAKLNRLRQELEEALLERQRQLQQLDRPEYPIDVTAPGDRLPLGHRHPVSLVLDELVELFWQMCYQVADGPEIETEWYNFEALNMPTDHPARDMQDTFYLEEGNLPRTHTSGIQIRYLTEHRDELPVRIIAPGKAYRNEDEDARHSWSFYQIEGLVVDQGVSLGDLKGTLETMLQGILGPDTAVRLRPNYFPYTEPSVEMDASCVICGGKGVISGVSCHLCSGTGWLELGGAGMIHPQVLRNVGIDPDNYSGFAFGFGPERLAAIKYGVDDVREFWRPNFRFLEQF